MAKISEKRSVRCAIYTRKSSEEGLEQSFNSLDAQREACQAYIQSQREEGWRALDTHYDDGGFSGGNMERPSLKRLLADIEARKVDTVVVYKVDRLTRSLADFAKMIEKFDAQGVSFVSVTQQFNTTSSMGRLTLNVLLSFAQFEREVTGERIRDKIAASKRKGMWMGGTIPVGYDIDDRKLIINEKGAELVREIFRLYLKFGCVRTLKKHLDEHGIRTTVRVSKTGRTSGGCTFSRGALHKILRSRTYLGEVPHKDKSYPGQHEPIIDRELWEQVQSRLSEGIRGIRHGTNAAAPSLLRGLVYDSEGNRLTPSHANKNGKRYRYYVSQLVIQNPAASTASPGRIPARDLEQVVLNELKGFFSSGGRAVNALAEAEDDVPITHMLIESGTQISKQLDGLGGAQLSELFSKLVTRVVVHQSSIEIHLDKWGMRAHLLGSNTDQQSRLDAPLSPITLSVDMRLRRYYGQIRLIVPGQPAKSDQIPLAPALVRAIARAHTWVQMIVSGEYKDQRAIAAATGLDERYVSKIINAAFLAPEIVETIFRGEQALEMTLGTLLAVLPFSWAEQCDQHIRAPVQKRSEHDSH
jgi:site-specific DNA recombinase